MELNNAFLLAIPIFFITMFIEYLFGLRSGRQLYRFSDTITNLTLGIGNVAFNLFFKLVLLFLYEQIYHGAHLFSIETNVVSIIFCVLIFDFIYYWAHRWSHEWNIYWAAHVVHHQSEYYNLSVALRQSWFHNVLAFALFIPMALLGFNTITFGIAALFVTLYQFWIHTEIIDKLPAWFEYVFNTPSHHRVHHGVNEKYIDKNHGAFLIIWDRIFGTFKAEEERPVYGITRPFNSWDPVWSNFHHFVEMYRLSRHLKTVREKFQMLFQKPGWRPEYLGGYEAPKDQGRLEVQKFDMPISMVKKRYVSIQFLLLLWGTVSYMMFFNELSLMHQLGGLGFLVWSLANCGYLLENRPMAHYSEWFRLAFVAGYLSFLYHQSFQEWFPIMLASSFIGWLVFSIWNYMQFKAERSLMVA